MNIIRRAADRELINTASTPAKIDHVTGAVAAPPKA